MAEASFDRWGPAEPTSPVVLSVPHAGRRYPREMTALLRDGLTVERLRALEDRHVDAVARGALGGCSALVQQVPRAWIDLNRGEDERDPAVDAGAPRSAGERSARLRSGLGLVPRRASGAGDLWRRRLTDQEVRARLADAHRPYHAALAALLDNARRRFGTAVLLDLHSMPPLVSARGGPPARVVLGDRFGRSAAARFTARAEAAARMDQGDGRLTPIALNAPYAGGHVLDRHGDPANGVHAIQLELDRTLYLDAALDRPGPGLPRTVALITTVIAALEDEALGGTLPLAAE